MHIHLAPQSTYLRTLAGPLYFVTLIIIGSSQYSSPPTTEDTGPRALALTIPSTLLIPKARRSIMILGRNAHRLRLLIWTSGTAGLSATTVHMAHSDMDLVTVLKLYMCVQSVIFMKTYIRHKKYFVKRNHKESPENYKVA